MARHTRLFAWKPVYETEIAEIDEQHREIASILNSIHRALKAGTPRAALLPMIDDLIRHTVFHFATEERLMQAAAYPRASHHRLEHTLLRTRALNFRRAAETDAKTNPEHLLAFLATWLDGHIQTADHALAEHLRSQE